jgi:hypothetical protein
MAHEDQTTPVHDEQEETDMNVYVPAPRAPQQTPREQVIGRNGSRIPGSPRSAR